MVTKIMRSGGTVMSALDYNQEKVDAGKAIIVSTSNIRDGEKGIRSIFRAYENRNIRSRNVSFHMSVNPSPQDMITDGQIPAFVSELMSGLGYGNQPYVLFRHDDIGRCHYHVVSVRVSYDGKKIPDRQEHRRCSEITRELSNKYGLETFDRTAHKRLSNKMRFKMLTDDSVEHFMRECVLAVTGKEKGRRR